VSVMTSEKSCRVSVRLRLPWAGTGRVSVRLRLPWAGMGRDQ
jgi:hypothetical protein